MVFYMLPMATFPVRHFEWQNPAAWVCTHIVQMAMQAADPLVVYSSYVESLDETAKARYREKLAMLGGVQDLYITINTIKSRDECLDWLNWPNIEYPRIFNYFVTSVSTYTKQQPKVFISLVGYRYIFCGWMDAGSFCLVGTREN